MHLTPAERLILLKLTQILERIDPAHAKQYDRDAQALELGSSAGIAVSVRGFGPGAGLQLAIRRTGDASEAAASHSAE